MNAPDTNMLLYAHNKNDPFYNKASAYLQRSLSSGDAYGVPLLSVQGFVRISTAAAFGSARLTLSQALSTVEHWLSRPNVRILYPGTEHWAILSRLALAGNTAGSTFTDAAIAAITIEHGAVLHSADRDFARFPGVRWHNPLQP